MLEMTFFDREVFGRCLKAARVLRRMRQEDLTTAMQKRGINAPPRTISNWECGRGTPKFEVWMALTIALALPIDWWKPAFDGDFWQEYVATTKPENARERI